MTRPSSSAPGWPWPGRWRSSSRRTGIVGSASIRAALEERGLRVTEPTAPDPDSGLTAAVIGVAGYGSSPAASIGARSEPDAVPVDFATIELGTSADLGAS